jgi:hypothetical protein
VGINPNYYDYLLDTSSTCIARLVMTWFWWAVALFTIGGSRGGVLSVVVELPFHRVRGVLKH